MNCLSKNYAFLLKSILLCALAFWIMTSFQTVYAEEQKKNSEQASQGDGTGASDPLSKTNSIDLKWTRLNSESGADTDNWWIKGNYSFAKWGKLSYELTYARTDDAGEITDGFDNLSLKPIFFLKRGELGSWKYGLATGFELVFDFADNDPSLGTIEGYGTGSDLLSPLFGVSFSKGNTILVPLVQHYVEFSGPDVNTTGFRLIAIQKFKGNYWAKADIILPYDWNNEIFPGTAELEVGKMLSKSFGIYGSGIAGIADSQLDWGASINVRFVF